MQTNYRLGSIQPTIQRTRSNSPRDPGGSYWNYHEPRARIKKKKTIVARDATKIARARQLRDFPEIQPARFPNGDEIYDATQRQTHFFLSFFFSKFNNATGSNRRSCQTFLISRLEDAFPLPDETHAPLFRSAFHEGEGKTEKKDEMKWKKKQLADEQREGFDENGHCSLIVWKVCVSSDGIQRRNERTVTPLKLPHETDVENTESVNKKKKK